MDKTKFKNVDEYLSSFPKQVQKILKKLRETIKESAPEASEIMSHNMPAYKVYGRILLYFAVHTKHIGLYAMPSAVVKFSKELTGLKTLKGTIRFPLDKEMPFELIKKIVNFRVKENLSKKK